MKKHAGVIFDWDGVVVDSSAAHARSWEILADERKLLLPENYLKRSYGRRNEEIIPLVLNWSDNPAEIRELSNRKEEIFRKIITEDGIEPNAGARRLLEDLKMRGIPCAIGSSSPRENIELALEIMDLRTAFAGIVTDENISDSENLPSVFLQAAATIERNPAETVVIEDSVSGIEAGLADGFKVVAVATTNPPELLRRTQAHYVAERLVEISVGLSEALVRK